MLNAFYYLAHGKRPQKQIKAVVEMRMLSMAGYMPDLVGCRECGSYESPEMLFLPKSGGIVCSACGRPEGGNGPAAFARRADGAASHHLRRL